MKFDMSVKVASRYGGYKNLKFTAAGKTEHLARRKVLEKFLLSGDQVLSLEVTKKHV